MTKEFFESVLRIPSVSRHEDMMIEFLMDWGPKHGCKTKKDAKGNVYMEKGSGIRPTLVNHVDTVHDDQKDMVKQRVFKEIVWEGDHVTAMNPLTGKQTGLGMDNQGGACIALAVIDRLKAVKAIFTVEEEIGMLGVQAADMSFFDDAAFVFSNDSPDENRATHYSSGVQLYSDAFFEKYLEPICRKHGVTSFRSEPYTCIKVVRSKWTDKDGKHIECLNFGNAGDKPHTDQEGASFKGVNNAEDLLYALCTEIPTDVQHVSDIKEEPRPSYGWSGYSGGSYAGRDWWKQWLGGRGGAGQQAFDFGQSEEESGSFEWNFKGPDAARLALDRLPKILGGVRTEKKEGNVVRVSGPKSKLRTAFRFSYNYDNKGRPGVPYKYDTVFYRDVQKASAAFEQKYEPDEKADGRERSPDAPCAISIYFAEADALTDFVRALNDRGNPAEVDDDGYSACTVSGRLEDVKAAYVEYVNSDAGGRRKFDRFEQLPKQDRKAFWEDVEFAEAGMDDDDGAIDADYEAVDDDLDSAPPAEPEKKADDDLWDWWKWEQEKDDSDRLRGHGEDEQCSIDLVFRVPEHVGKFERNVRDVGVDYDRTGPGQYTVSGPLGEVMNALVAYLNSVGGRSAAYGSFDSIPVSQKQQFWKEVRFGKDPGKDRVV